MGADDLGDGGMQAVERAEVDVVVRVVLERVLAVGPEEAVGEPLGEVGEQQCRLRRERLLARRPAEQLDDLVDGRQVAAGDLRRRQVAAGVGPVGQRGPRGVGGHRAERVRSRLRLVDRGVDQRPVRPAAERPDRLHQRPERAEVRQEERLGAVPEAVARGIPAGGGVGRRQWRGRGRCRGGRLGVGRHGHGLRDEGRARTARRVTGGRILGPPEPVQQGKTAAGSDPASTLSDRPGAAAPAAPAAGVAGRAGAAAWRGRSPAARVPRPGRAASGPAGSGACSGGRASASAARARSRCCSTTASIPRVPSHCCSA